MTRWTWEQYEDLSRRVAVKFGIKPPTFDFEGSVGQIDSDTYPVWIYNDWNTIMELCVKHGVNAEHKLNTEAISPVWTVKCTFLIKGQWIVVRHDDHGNNPSLAERVARLLTLMEVEL